MISAGTLLDEEPNYSQKEHDFDGVFGVASTKRARDRIRSAKTIREVSNGSVSGIPVLLLNEGMILNFDVKLCFVRRNYQRGFRIWTCRIYFGSHHEISPRSFL